MAAVTVWSDFRAQENKVCHCFHFSHLFALKWWDWSDYKNVSEGSSVLNTVLLFSYHVWHFCDPVDCSLPGSSVHGFPKQRYWNGLPFSFLQDVFLTRDRTHSPGLAGEFFTTEPSGKLSIQWHLFILHCQLSFAESFLISFQALSFLRSKIAFLVFY